MKRNKGRLQLCYKDIAADYKQLKTREADETVLPRKGLPCLRIISGVHRTPHLISSSLYRLYTLPYYFRYYTASAGGLAYLTSSSLYRLYTLSLALMIT